MASSTTSREVSAGRCSNYSRRWRSSLVAAWSRGSPRLAPVMSVTARPTSRRPDVTSATSPSSACMPAFARRSNGRCHRLERTGLEPSIRPLGVLDPALFALAHGRNAEWAPRMDLGFVRVSMPIRRLPLSGSTSWQAWADRLSRISIVLVVHRAGVTQVRLHLIGSGI